MGLITEYLTYYFALSPWFLYSLGMSDVIFMVSCYMFKLHPKFEVRWEGILS